MSNTTKRGYKDSLFRRFFENPLYLSELHTLLTGQPTAPEDIQITTLRSVLFNRQKNDLSFQVGNHFLVLMEHQSSITRNMPLRMLFYVAMLYRKYIPKRFIYYERMLPLPTPEFYVFYNGDKELPEKSTLRLSDAFPEKDSSLELVVTIFNIRYNESNELLQRCKTLHDYSFFTYRVEEAKRQGLDPEHAVLATIRYCIDHDIMRDFLNAHYEEVFDMVSLRWNEKDEKKAIKEETETITREETALGMLRDKMDIQLIMKYTKLSLNRINELAKML